MGTFTIDWSEVRRGSIVVEAESLEAARALAYDLDNKALDGSVSRSDFDVEVYRWM